MKQYLKVEDLFLLGDDQILRLISILGGRGIRPRYVDRLDLNGLLCQRTIHETDRVYWRDFVPYLALYKLAEALTIGVLLELLSTTPHEFGYSLENGSDCTNMTLVLDLPTISTSSHYYDDGELVIPHEVRLLYTYIYPESGDLEPFETAFESRELCDALYLALRSIL